ncbi:CoF synthetase [Flagellimonas meishanensis]|uniref:CoF synthetase n=1 Tax=Flagellimonas meishanensis TaxID=2873264 RepID=UPI001CA6F036|nr:CoF synthetase [[Muricauda] meishanensis]
MSKNLNNLLNHATENTAFYKHYRGFSGLRDFPIINKNIILDRYGEFKSNKFLKSKLFKASSSGSTGIPFSIYQDKGKRARNTADVIYFSDVVGSRVGEKLVYIKLWDHTNRKSNWALFAQNIFPHNVTDSSPEAMQRLLEQLGNDNSNKSILGYPSFFEELCDYLDGRSETPKINNVSSIISIAEGLKESERKRMSHYFGAKAYERYSNQENGILAQQTPSSAGGYILNWASYHFEFLALESDEHVMEGELGRIVVTDLFNFAMPMIRYDTGDMGIYKKNENGLPSLATIYGRRMDAIFDTQGKIVSPFVFYQVLDYAKVKQFQFIQQGKKNYLFRLNGRSESVAEKEIARHFEPYLGADAHIDFEYVDEIPLLSSGKRKKIVNDYKSLP